jgi:LytS/YehU family sensor histidine kinase
MDLQKLRVEDPSYIHFQFSGDNQVAVPPLIFMTFVENAFKHGKKDDSTTIIDIQIHSSIDKLEFRIQNHIILRKQMDEKTEGIGLTNIKRRLALIYPGKHDLVIREDGSKFIVELNINFV